MCALQEQDGDEVRILFEPDTNLDSIRPCQHALGGEAFYIFLYVMFVQSLYHKSRPHVFFCWLYGLALIKSGIGVWGLQVRDLEEDETGFHILDMDWQRWADDGMREGWKKEMSSMTEW
jgi:hypothetical protein